MDPFNVRVGFRKCVKLFDLRTGQSERTLHEILNVNTKVIELRMLEIFTDIQASKLNEHQVPDVAKILNNLVLNLIFRSMA